MKNETACPLMKPGKGRQQRNSRVTCGYGWRWGYTRLCAVGQRLRPGPRVWSPPGEGQGAGACQPLAPYNPLPRLRQPSLTGIISPQLIPFSPLPAARHRASPFRCPARGTSVRAAAELPPLRGGDLRRAMPRLRHQTGWPEALEAEKHHAE